jgi:hypothetical protein
LTLEQVGEALAVFAKQKHLAAIEVTAYNPAKDPDGRGAKLIVDLLIEVLGERLETLKAAAVPTDAAANPPAAVSVERPAPAPSSSEAEVPAVAAGEAWSSDMVETETESPDADAPDGESTQSAVESDDPHSR